jgi:hypothetical protein
LKEGDSLSLMLVNFALEYAIRAFRETQDEFEFNGTRHLLVCDDDDDDLLEKDKHHEGNRRKCIRRYREAGIKLHAEKAT